MEQFCPPLVEVDILTREDLCCEVAVVVVVCARLISCVGMCVCVCASACFVKVELSSQEMVPTCGTRHVHVPVHQNGDGMGSVRIS